MVKQIEALGRGLAVLNLLERSGPMGLSAVARECGVPKATALRILCTLEAGGYARQRLADRFWQATLRRQGAVPTPHGRLAEIAGPVLDALCQRVLWPSDVGVYEDGSIRVLETSRRLSPFLVNRDVISRRIHVVPSAMGRALLAWSGPATRERMLSDLTRRDEPHDRPARDPERLAQLVAETRARGYAVRHPGYFISVPREAQVTAVAVPVLAAGEAVAAINLSWVASAMSEGEFVARHLAELSSAADDIAGRIAGG